MAAGTVDAIAMHRTFENLRTIDSASAGVGPDGYEHSARSVFGVDVKHALLQLLGAQNESLVTHLAEVAKLATSTALSLGLSPAQVRLTRLGAELHDIGKVGIPESILDKRGPLTAEEQWFMQRHSEIGERILAAIPALKAVAPIVRAVHERPDGKGYPDGLRLEAIPDSRARDRRRRCVRRHDTRSPLPSSHDSRARSRGTPPTRKHPIRLRHRRGLHQRHDTSVRRLGRARPEARPLWYSGALGVRRPGRARARERCGCR